ncbi:MAG: recombinase family protein, partial [Nitrospira sp.]|nr:recombinase family protein [Nitrospira sp.]
ASDRFAASVLPIVEGYTAKGLTVREVAEELNKRGVTTLRGGAWHGSTVVKLRKRAKGL